MSFIDPKLLDTYLWLPENEDKESITILFKAPETVSLDSIKYELREDGDAIFVGIEGQQPFFAGTLFKKAKEISHSVEDGIIRLKIIKAEPQDWDQIIQAPLKESIVIDPKSAFVISQYLFAVIEGIAQQEKTGEKVDLEQFKNIATTAHNYLKIAVAARFPDALVNAASITLNSSSENKEKDAAILLTIAADEYNLPNAHFLLGLILIQKEDTVVSSIPHFQAAYDGGILDALNALGEIYSPEQTPHISDEDAKKAAEYFEEVLRVNPDHSFALMNMARLLATGKGVEKDIPKAKEYQKKALSINPELESFEIEDGDKKAWIAAGAATAVAAAAGVAAYNILKKHK